MKDRGMSIVVKRITRITVSLIFMFGVYILFHGHLTPGGGFAGGVIIALAFIHLMLAFGKDEIFRRLDESRIKIIESAGGCLFLGIAMTGFIGGYFFMNVVPKGRPFDLFSSGIILLCNIAIFLEVGAGLLGIFVALALWRIPLSESSDDSRDDPGARGKSGV
jgi:multisubunit Na+/H+ antiporter MnhB subunit